MRQELLFPHLGHACLMGCEEDENMGIQSSNNILVTSKNLESKSIF